MSRLTIGTRGSELALWQANTIREKLQNQSSTPIEIKVIKTKGDQIDNLPFSKIDGKGFFTKELEDCLLNGEIDLAVHSMKDLQTELPEGLVVGAAGSGARARGLLNDAQPLDFAALYSDQADVDILDVETAGDRLGFRCRGEHGRSRPRLHEHGRVAADRRFRVDELAPAAGGDDLNHVVLRSLGPAAEEDNVS